MMKSAPVRAVALATLIHAPSVHATPSISHFSRPGSLFTFGDANPPYIPAFGHGTSMFGGTTDNTEVFFRVMQGVLGGVR